jgi:hypothetical protein
MRFFQNKHSIKNKAGLIIKNHSSNSATKAHQ